MELHFSFFLILSRAILSFSCCGLSLLITVKLSLLLYLSLPFSDTFLK